MKVKIESGECNKSNKKKKEKTSVVREHKKKQTNKKDAAVYRNKKILQPQFSLFSVFERAGDIQSGDGKV